MTQPYQLQHRTFQIIRMLSLQACRVALEAMLRGICCKNTDWLVTEPADEADG